MSFIKKSSVEEMFTLFFQQLYIMSLSGMALEESLRLLADSAGEKELRSIASVALGETKSPFLSMKYRKRHLSHCLEILRDLMKKPDSESNQTVLKMMKKDMHRRVVIRKGIIGRLTYPITQLIILIAVLNILLTFVIPQFALMFTEIDADLPALTKSVMNISQVFHDNGFVIILFCIVLAGLLIRGAGDFLLSVLPFFSSIMRDSTYAQFFGYFSTFLHLGENMQDAYRKSSQLLLNRYFSWRLQKKSGDASLHEQIEKTFRDPIIGSIVNSGEKSETLPQTLEALAEHYNEVADTEVEGVLTILEPFMILITGTLVGIVVVSLYLPMFDLFQFIK